VHTVWRATPVSRWHPLRRIRRSLIDIEVPSGPPSLPLARHVRLLALLPIRDHLHYLPGYIASIAPQVDGIIALDDGSTDGTGEFLESRREVLEVLRNPPDRPTWDEMGNHQRLLAAALRHGAEWVVNVDADERLERDFRRRCERVIRRGRLLGYTAYGLRLRDLWDSRDHYRADGIWGDKTTPRLYKARPDHKLDGRALHGSKAPLQARVCGRYPIADLNIYHLGMLTPELRDARRKRYEALDPTARWQPKLGYAYLTDCSGLQRFRIAKGREYVDTETNAEDKAPNSAKPARPQRG
jgi:glycosyltransferase involved in cell wall biosynthesis